MKRFSCACVLTASLCLLFLLSVADGQTVTIREINPTRSSVGGTVNGSGGRVNHLARATNNIFYAATEYGGLYKSTDAGRTWSRLDTHLPTRLSDVKASPADPNRVIATSLYDGRVNSFAGINVSSDGGATWSKPASASPPISLCSGLSVNNEPSAYGIAFDPANAHVFVGTNCGLAKSTDGGLNWTFINPGLGTRATNVFAVVVHHGGIIDTCGSAGHLRSTDGGAVWTGPQPGGTPLMPGPCSIAASPDESSVLFATVGTRIFESDNGGRSWDTQFVNPAQQGRVTFVATNNRQGRNFDLWFGDTLLFRAGCTTPATPGPGARCPASSTWTRVDGQAHRDMGEVVFTDPPPINLTACHQDCTNGKSACDKDCADDLKSCMDKVGQPGEPLASQCNQNASRCRAGCTSSLNTCNTNCDLSQEGCPIVLSSDGGTYFNTRTQSPACQTPEWAQPTVTTRALWLWSLSGADIPSSSTKEAVYMGAQDDGAFVTLNAGADIPDWKNPDGFDVSDVVPDTTQIVFTICCLGTRGNQVFRRDPAMVGGGEIPNYPPGFIPFGLFPDIIARFGANRFALATSSGIFATQNISANPIAWTSLGTNAPILAGGLWAAGPQTNPTFYALTSNQATLLRYNGTSATGTWQNVTLPPGFVSVAVFAVDPNNPNRLFVSAFNSTRVQMFRSSDGGTTWASDTVLDRLMIGSGTFRMQSSTLNYLQPTLVAFDPNDSNTLLAGAADAGIFLSRDNGVSWVTLTNNSGSTANPIIPRPHWAYFDRECGQANIYVGTQGRGAWHFSYRDSAGTTVSACQARCESSLSDCRNNCASEQADCLAEVGKPGGLLASQCNQNASRCRADCSDARDACRQHCVDCPQ
ncbi:MAG TPA: YCF48-related protein [Pyrinomonadaceae bacterium]|nr:YCF48-related protein [Pyrinomonadaceae bacterium]